ncbi:hypothetical protein KUV57_12550 [Epibacterium sp. DP7N7-1]|nr:hypothetical protein [Epibacterium sp. DP7N7-1]
MSSKNPKTQGRRYAEAIGAIDMTDESLINPWKNERKGSWNAKARADQWQAGFKAGVENNLVTEEVTKRASVMSELSKRPYYHVTSPENASDIQSIGFLGGWGDDGFGVYLFDGLHHAADYALNGGWDGALTEAVIIEIRVDPAELDEIHPDPGWPNPEDYADVYVHRMDEDDPLPWEVDLEILPRGDLIHIEGFEGSSLDISEKSKESEAETPHPG